MSSGCYEISKKKEWKKNEKKNESFHPFKKDGNLNSW